MITKLNSKQLEKIIEIITDISEFHIDSYDATLDRTMVIRDAKKEVAEYLQLPDLFNCD